MNRALLDKTIACLKQELDGRPTSNAIEKQRTLTRLQALRAGVCATPDLCGTVCTLCRDDWAIAERYALWNRKR